jgi:hypothetical protein
MFIGSILKFAGMPEQKAWLINQVLFFTGRRMVKTAPSPGEDFA